MKQKHFLAAVIAVFGTVAVSGAALGAQGPQFLADRHGKMGIKCEMCHVSKDQEPSIEQCQACHATSALVAKTKDLKPQNPHVSPHYQDKLDCVNCHHGHEKSENFCSQCHEWKFKKIP